MEVVGEARNRIKRKSDSLAYSAWHKTTSPCNRRGEGLFMKVVRKLTR